MKLSHSRMHHDPVLPDDTTGYKTGRSFSHFLSLLPVLALLLISTGCTKHEIEVKPVEIKPIHITIDINVKVDRALDDFFGDLDQAATQ